MHPWIRLMICLLPLAGCGSSVTLRDGPIEDTPVEDRSAAEAPQENKGRLATRPVIPPEAGGPISVAQEPSTALPALKPCPASSSVQWQSCLGSLRYPNGDQYLGHLEVAPLV